VPRGTDILEITRFCLDRSLRAADRRHSRDRLVTALTAYAIEHGITAYTGVAEIGWFQQIANFGWRCALLGLPRIVGGRTLVAMRIEIDDETPDLLAAGGIWTAPAWQPPGMAAELRA